MSLSEQIAKYLAEYMTYNEAELDNLIIILEQISKNMVTKNDLDKINNIKSQITILQKQNIQTHLKTPLQTPLQISQRNEAEASKVHKINEIFTNFMSAETFHDYDILLAGTADEYVNLTKEEAIKKIETKAKDRIETGKNEILKNIKEKIKPTDTMTVEEAIPQITYNLTQIGAEIKWSMIPGMQGYGPGMIGKFMNFYFANNKKKYIVSKMSVSPYKVKIDDKDDDDNTTKFWYKKITPTDKNYFYSAEYEDDFTLQEVVKMTDTTKTIMDGSNFIIAVDKYLKFIGKPPGTPYSADDSFKIVVIAPSVKGEERVVQNYDELTKEGSKFASENMFDEKLKKQIVESKLYGGAISNDILTLKRTLVAIYITIIKNNIDTLNKKKDKQETPLSKYDILLLKLFLSKLRDINKYDEELITYCIEKLNFKPDAAISVLFLTHPKEIEILIKEYAPTKYESLTKIIQLKKQSEYEKFKINWKMNTQSDIDILTAKGRFYG